MTGGLGLLKRINNNPAEIAALSAEMTDRFHAPMAVKLNADSRSTLWISIDYSIPAPYAALFLGADWSAVPWFQTILGELTALTETNKSLTASEQYVSVSALEYFQENQMGFSLYSTVYEDDPSQVMVAAAVLLTPYFDGLIAKAAGSVATKVTDPFGRSTTSAQNGCDLKDAEQILSASMQTAQTIQPWVLEIAQCPSYADSFVASSQKSRLVWVYIAVIAVGAGLVCAAVVFAAFLNEKDFKLRIAMATHSESTRAHRWIIGYGESLFQTWSWWCRRTGRTEGCSTRGGVVPMRRLPPPPRVFRRPLSFPFRVFDCGEVVRDGGGSIPHCGAEPFARVPAM